MTKLLPLLIFSSCIALSSCNSSPALDDEEKAVSAGEWLFKNNCNEIRSNMMLCIYEKAGKTFPNKTLIECDKALNEAARQLKKAGFGNVTAQSLAIPKIADNVAGGLRNKYSMSTTLSIKKEACKAD